MRILIVDDSKTIVHVMTKILNELGYANVDKAHNCDEAKLRISVGDALPDLIISDWNMPGGSGLDLLKYVRGTKSIARTPFILLTSDQDRSKIFQAKQYNPQFYLLKPPNKHILAEKLSLLAKTHGIQPPLGSAGESPDSSTAVDDTGAPTDSELVARILKQSVFVLTGRKTHKDFRAFLGRDVFNVSPDAIKLQHIQELSDTVHSIFQHLLYTTFESKD